MMEAANTHRRRRAWLSLLVTLVFLLAASPQPASMQGRSPIAIAMVNASDTPDAMEEELGDSLANELLASLCLEPAAGASLYKSSLFESRAAALNCTSFTVDTGLFIDTQSVAWLNERTMTKGGKTVTLTDTGISVTGPTGSLFHTKLLNHVLRYMFFGSNNYLLILDSENTAGPITRRVSLVDFTTTPPTERLIITASQSNTATPAPNVQFSQGTGSAFLVFNSTGGAIPEIRNLGIYRSDTGTPLCAGPGPLGGLTGEIQGEATATELRIHYSTSGVHRVTACPLPSGSSDVQPSSQTFPTAVVGLTPPTRQFTIRNDGNDCLTIDAIGSVAPFSVTATSIPLPASLKPGQMMIVTVTFAPQQAGMFGPTSLPITRTPARGDGALVVRGSARLPITKIGFSASSLSFGEVSLGTSKSLTLQIRNDGETNLGVSLAAPPPGSPFQWSAFNGIIPVGGSHLLTVLFIPVDQEFASGTLLVASDDPASPSAIALSGRGVITCDGHVATIVGTGRINGTSRDDVIVGSAGRDVIAGNSGDDIICSGAGNDFVHGGTGNDRIFAEDGNDTEIFGGSGDDWIWGGLGNDTLSGNDGDDKIAGEADQDTIIGGSGNDVIDGGPGNDLLLDGDEGDDLVDGDIGDDLLRGGSGDDQLLGDEGADTLRGEQGNDLLRGQDDNDSLHGGPGFDTLEGDSGTDTCNVGSGGGTVNGCER